MNKLSERNRALENEIITLLRRKDERAISLLYQNYSNALYGIITNTIQDSKVAQEVLQDVFLKVWKNADKYDVQKGRLYTWLARITRNAAIDTFRSGKYQRGLQSTELDAVVSNDRRHSEELHIADSGLMKIIHEMDPKYRSVIKAVYFQGYSQSEAAKQLDIPLGTVKTRVRAAIVELRKSLGDDIAGLSVIITVLINSFNDI